MQDFSPVRQGQTDPPLHAVFTDKLGNVLSLPAGTTFTCYIYNPSKGTTVIGAGTWTPVNLTSGQADYKWAATDSATVGEYEVYIGYVRPTGEQGFSDPEQWQVLPITYQQ